jgi:hypothetical protein
MTGQRKTITFMNGRLKFEVNGYGRMMTDISRSEDTSIDGAIRNSTLDAIDGMLVGLVNSGVITQNEDPRVNRVIQETLDIAGIEL